MHFLYVLVIIVAVLAVFSGLALVFGSPKSEKAQSSWFLLASIGGMIWAISVVWFLSLDSGALSNACAPWAVQGIYIGALLMDAALLTYIAWRYKIGRFFSVFFIVIGLILATLLVYDPSALYSKIMLEPSGNSVVIDTNKAFYAVYLAYFGALNVVLCLFMIYRIRHTANKKFRKGLSIFLVGLIATGVLSGIFDLVLPLFRYDLIWVGPLTIGLTILGFYFSILRFKMISLSSTWLKILSSIVIVSSAFVVYLLIFHLVFSALFKIPNPSNQVLLLNFIMIAIVLALVPAFSEIIGLTKSLIMTKQINLPYVVKKLSSIDYKKADFKDISGFLSEYLHFSYVGFLIKNKLYVANECEIPADLLVKISELPMPVRESWQDAAKLGDASLKKSDISRVAILVGSNGEMVGQMIFGQPTSKSTLDRKDLAEITIINSLVGIIIENSRLAKK